MILTGSDPYYCAGVDLGGSLRPMMPKALFEVIRVKNQALFDAFINFQKPLIIAVNGPAIGASVTSATLCESATLYTSSACNHHCAGQATPSSHPRKPHSAHRSTS